MVKLPFLVVALCLTATSWASQRVVEPGDNAPITTPYGPVPAHIARGICAAEFAFIGTIATVATREEFWGDHESAVISDLNFTVERRLHGALDKASSFLVTVPGGDLPGGGRVRSSGGPYPIPEVGRRYFLALATAKAASGRIKVGQPIFISVYELPNDVALPSERFIADQIDTLCAGNGLIRYSEPAPPTE